MPDDKDKIGEPDRDRISVSDPNEVRDWCDRLSVSEQKLREARKTAGPMVDDVKTLLENGDPLESK
jgi:Protein of unknown function (DUF3606)